MPVLGAWSSLLVRVRATYSTTSSAGSPLCSRRRALASTSSLAPVADSRTLTMIEDTRRPRIQAMNSATCWSMIPSASPAAAMRRCRPSSITSARSSMVYRYTSGSLPASRSMSCGTARSAMNIGRRLRRRTAARVCSTEMIGSRLPVDEMTTSASARWSGTSSSEIAYAPSAVAIRRACSRVRFAITMRPMRLDAR